jgi:hypothetical protein
MKTKKIIAFTNLKWIFVFGIFALGCNKQQTMKTYNPSNTTQTKYKIGEPDFKPKDVAEAKQIVTDFIGVTKFAKKQTRTDYPEKPLSEVVWIMEGAANYLENPNYRQFFREEASFTVEVTKLPSGNISGADLVSKFQTLMAEITARENGHQYKANLVNGYTIAENEISASIKFDVTFGDPLPLGYTYPSTDQNYCDAAAILTDGINTKLQSEVVFCTGVVDHLTFLLNDGSTPYYGLFFSQTNNNVFPTNMFTTYEQKGIQAANIYMTDYILTTQSNPSGTSSNNNMRVVAVNIKCDAIYPQTNSYYLHVMNHVKTSTLLANY